MNTYEHFSKRLKERYNMEITEEEYIKLSQSMDYITTEVGCKRKKVLFLFRGRMIYAVKRRFKDKLYITALPIHAYKSPKP